MMLVSLCAETIEPVFEGGICIRAVVGAVLGCCVLPFCCLATREPRSFFLPSNLQFGHSVGVTVLTF